MNQIKAYLFWLFRQPQHSSVQVRIVETPVAEGWLKTIYFSDVYGRETCQFRLDTGDTGFIISKKEAEQVLIRAAIANSKKDETIR